KGLQAAILGPRSDLSLAIGRRLSDENAVVVGSNSAEKTSKAGRARVDLAIFARLWPGDSQNGVAALGRQLEDDIGRAQTLAAKPAPGLRVIFALVLAVGDGACDVPLAAGLKPAWTLAVRQCARDLRRQGVGCCGVVAATPLDGMRRPAKAASELALTVEQASHLVALVARDLGPSDAGVILDRTDID